MIETKELLDGILELIQKGLYDQNETDGEAIPMRNRGAWQPNVRYLRGDVVSIQSVGLFQAVVDTMTDPRSKSEDWTAVFVSTGATQGATITFFPPTNDVFNVTVNGTNTFSLSQAPVYPATVQFFVNGVRYPADFTLAGSIVTWNNIFSINIGDQVAITYF